MGLKLWQTGHKIAEKSSKIVPLGAPLPKGVQPGDMGYTTYLRHG
jgi:hypothetical protein